MADRKLSLLKMSAMATLVAGTAIAVAAVTGCAAIENKQSSDAVPIMEASDKPAPAMPAEPTRVSLIAIGDIVAHDEMIAQSRTDHGYDFEHVFAPMKDSIQSYDLASVTQETPLVQDESHVGGYPVFGTPVAIGDALVNTGYDIIVSATNHSMDQGADGVLDTARYWRESHPEIVVLGIHEQPENADSVRIIDKNGVEIALSDFTYGMNGFVLPDGREYEVDLLSEIDQIAENVQKAERDVDITICYVHMGEEYSTVPSEEQRWAAEKLIDAGADVVIGSHVHVVQPMETVTTPAGNTGIVYYGLGNSASNQDDVINMLGGAAILTIEKTPNDDGNTSNTAVIEHSFVPTFCHYDENTTQMYFLNDYNDALASVHKVATAYGHPFTVESVRRIWKEITGLE